MDAGRLIAMWVEAHEIDLNRAQIHAFVDRPEVDVILSYPPPRIFEAVRARQRLTEIVEYLRLPAGAVSRATAAEAKGPRSQVRYCPACEFTEQNCVC